MCPPPPGAASGAEDPGPQPNIFRRTKSCDELELKMSPVSLAPPILFRRTRSCLLPESKFSTELAVRDPRELAIRVDCTERTETTLFVNGLGHRAACAEGEKDGAEYSFRCVQTTTQSTVTRSSPNRTRKWSDRSVLRSCVQWLDGYLSDNACERSFQGTAEQSWLNQPLSQTVPQLTRVLCDLPNSVLDPETGLADGERSARTVATCVLATLSAGHLDPRMLPILQSVVGDEGRRLEKPESSTFLTGTEGEEVNKCQIRAQSANANHLVAQPIIFRRTKSCEFSETISCLPHDSDLAPKSSSQPIIFRRTKSCECSELTMPTRCTISPLPSPLSGDQNAQDEAASRKRSVSCAQPLSEVRLGNIKAGGPSSARSWSEGQIPVIPSDTNHLAAQPIIFRRTKSCEFSEMITSSSTEDQILFCRTKSCEFSELIMQNECTISPLPSPLGGQTTQNNSLRASNGSIQRQQQEHREEPSNANCSNCGNKYMPDSVFCRRCGTPKEQIKETSDQVCDARCTNCGNEYLPDSAFCRKCGTPREHHPKVDTAMQEHTKKADEEQQNEEEQHQMEFLTRASPLTTPTNRRKPRDALPQTKCSSSAKRCSEAEALVQPTLTRTSNLTLDLFQSDDSGQSDVPERVGLEQAATVPTQPDGATPLHENAFHEAFERARQSTQSCIADAADEQVANVGAAKEAASVRTYRTDRGSMSGGNSLLSRAMELLDDEQETPQQARVVHSEVEMPSDAPKAEDGHELLQQAGGEHNTSTLLLESMQESRGLPHELSSEAAFHEAFERARQSTQSCIADAADEQVANVGAAKEAASVRTYRTDRGSMSGGNSLLSRAMELLDDEQETPQQARVVHSEVEMPSDAPKAEDGHELLQQAGGEHIISVTNPSVPAAARGSSVKADPSTQTLSPRALRAQRFPKKRLHEVAPTLISLQQAAVTDLSVLPLESERQGLSGPQQQPFEVLPLQTSSQAKHYLVECSGCFQAFTTVHKFCTFCGSPNEDQQLNQLNTKPDIPAPQRSSSRGMHMEIKKFAKAKDQQAQQMTMELDHVVAHRLVDHSRVAAPSHRSVNRSRAPAPSNRSVDRLRVPAPSHRLVGRSRIPAPSHRSVDNSHRIDTRTRTKPDAIGRNKNWSKQGQRPSEESPIGISCIPSSMTSHECTEMARKGLAELQDGCPSLSDTMTAVEDMGWKWVSETGRGR